MKKAQYQRPIDALRESEIESRKAFNDTFDRERYQDFVKSMKQFIVDVLSDEFGIEEHDVKIRPNLFYGTYLINTKENSELTLKLMEKQLNKALCDLKEDAIDEGDLEDLKFMVRLDFNSGNIVVSFKLPQAFINICKMYIHEKLYQNPYDILFGMDDYGQFEGVNLNDMSAMLVTGITGSGKSVAITQIILSLFEHYTKDELDLYIDDPKRVEYGIFKDIIGNKLSTDDNQRRYTRQRLVDEVNNREAQLQFSGFETIRDYNQMEEPSKRYPTIVAVFDEISDIYMHRDEEAQEFKDLFRYIIEHGKRLDIHIILSTQMLSELTASFIDLKELDVAMILMTDNLKGILTDTYKLTSQIKRMHKHGDSIIIKKGHQGFNRNQALYISDNMIQAYLNELDK